MTTSTKSDSAAKRDVTKLQRAIVDGLEDVKAQPSFRSTWDEVRARSTLRCRA